MRPQLLSPNGRLVRESLERLGAAATEDDRVCVERLRAVVRVRIRRSARPALACRACTELYDSLADYDACPFCGAAPEDAITALLASTSHPPDREVPIVVGRSEIESAKAQVRHLSRTCLKDLYEIGRIFNTVFAKGLWTKDTTYRSGNFLEWCEKTTGWSPGGARDLMQVALHFTWEQVERLGQKPAGLKAIAETFAHIENERVRSGAIDATCDRIGAIQHPISAREAGRIAQVVLGTLGQPHQPRALKAREPRVTELAVHYEKRQRTAQLSINDVGTIETPAGKLRVTVSAEGLKCELIK